MFSLQKIFIILILLFQNNIFLINASTTDFEMDRVCSASNFAKYKHKTGYRTAQHFADDEGMYTSSAHPFYRSLFMTREKNNMSLFISSIGFELFIVALGIASFINYIVFIVLWSFHKGFFRILSDEEKAEKQSSACKYCKFFFMFICLLISMALSGFGILFISNLKNTINLSDCGYLRFTNHGLYGVDKNFAGTFNLKESFLNYTYSLNLIETFYSRMNLFDNNINALKKDFNDRMDECNIYAVEDSIYSPNPEKGDFDFIKVNYQEIYGPKTNESTLLGIINKNYNDKIVPILDILEEIKIDYKNFLDNKESYIIEVEKYAKYFDIMTQMYQTINENIGRVYDEYTDMGVNAIYYITMLMYIIFPFIIILLIIFVFLYVCKKQAGKCILIQVRIIIHVLWNFLFIFTAIGFVISGYIGSYRKYSYDLSASFNHLISSKIIIDPNSEENIFQEFANNSEISRAIGLFSDCYSSSQSTNIANILSITDSLLFYFNKLYQDYNSLLKYVYHNNLNEDIYPLVENNITLLNTFLYNISKTTTPKIHLENDVSRYFEILNKYTDFGNEETYQINCITKMYDVWASNKDDCPRGYTYSIDGSQTKNCLVISDSVWTVDMITIRYLPVCKMANGGSTGVQIDKYLQRIKGFYDANNNLIINMKNGAEILIGLYEDLIDSFEIELRIDNNTFINFTEPFSKFTDVEDIYSIFDCGILRQDLIDFYDIVRNKLSLISIAHLVILLLLCIFNVVAIYLLMTVLYTFYRTKDDHKNVRKSIKESTDNKLLTINKSKKRKSSVKERAKGKTKSKLYVSMGKGSESETPSSSTENVRSSRKSYESESGQDEEEEEESDERTGKSKTGSSQSGSGSYSQSKSYSKSHSKSKSGTSGTESNSKSYSKSKSKSKSGKRSNKEGSEEEEDEDIESGVRDDGSAMS